VVGFLSTERPDKFAGQLNAFREGHTQCENLPDRIMAPQRKPARNRDRRDSIADTFLGSSGADVREGAGEGLFCAWRRFSSHCLHSRPSRTPVRHERAGGRLDRGSARDLTGMSLRTVFNALVQKQQPQRFLFR
jgi:hypothetical protein